MDESAFAENGCIIDQRKFGGLRFGLRSSDQNGCAWVAAYNARLLLDAPASMAEVLGGIKQFLLLGGLNGAPLYALPLYFRQKGFRVRLTTCKNHFDRQARHFPANILLYFHRKGGHYVCFSPLENGTFRFYNDLYGVAYDPRSMSRFLKDHQTPLPMILLSIGK